MKTILLFILIFQLNSALHFLIQMVVLPNVRDGVQVVILRLVKFLALLGLNSPRVYRSFMLVELKVSGILAKTLKDHFNILPAQVAFLFSCYHKLFVEKI